MVSMKARAVAGWFFLGLLAGVPAVRGAESGAGVAPATRAVPAGAPPFTFVAIGCMPYSRVADSGAHYARVLAEINRHKPAFAIHLGDVMGGDEACTDALLEQRRREFDSVEVPMLYTPGDNEWTDVHRNGKDRPLERLAKIREIFFAREQSLGRVALPLVTQRRSAEFAQFAENARWILGTVVFASVHVVGSGNNHQPTVAGAVEEWRVRDRANAAWLRETFAEAKSGKAPGVAVFCQANPLAGGAGFALFLETLVAEARAFGRPVLLVHADEHRYRLEPGIRIAPGTEPVPNLTRLETFGASDLHGVLVTVDPASEAVFLPGPMIVPGNALPQLPRPETKLPQ